MSPLDAAVSAMLAGAPVGALARRLDVAESTLYRHRDTLAPTSTPADLDDACMRVLAELDRP